MIREIAPAKINLALHVRHRRSDGYHELETLFAFATDGDVVTVSNADTGSFTIIGPFASGLNSSPIRGGGSAQPVEGQLQAQNLVIKAQESFVQAFAITQSHSITLEKNLPIASGIGGGSADAAATLRALATLHGITHADPALFRIAAALGADIPACLLGRTTIGTGKGDALIEIDGFPDTPLLLVNPLVRVSTAKVFAAWDGHDRGPIPEGDLFTRARAARNDLEAPATALAPVIAQVRAQLDTAPGAILSRMSGSGATCFALFEDTATRDAAARIAEAQGWWTLRTFLS